MQRAILLRILAARRDARMVVRAVDIKSGAELLLDPSRDTSELAKAAVEVARDDTARRVMVDGREWFLSVYNTPWEIVIVGAVHIAQALAALAGQAGYRVRVIDPRGLYATDERFRGVALETVWPEEALARRPLTVRSALVALAHDPKLDDEALMLATGSQAFYIGALGSARTHGRRLQRLAEKGLTPQRLARIRGPVGLSIGARSPAEIALAILAELVQARRRSPRIAGVVLAGGMSSRMGDNKLLMQVRGKLLVRHAVDAAQQAGLDPVIVVTGHQAEKVQAALKDAGVVFAHNADFAQGLSTSLRAGIAAVPAQCDGAMVFLGDMPDIGPALVRRLSAAFHPPRGRAIIVGASNGERGHPVLWGRQFFGEIESLSGDAGARSLMQAHPEAVFDVESGDRAPLTDIDTPAAMNLAGSGS